MISIQNKTIIAIFIAIMMATSMTAIPFAYGELVNKNISDTELERLIETGNKEQLRHTIETGFMNYLNTKNEQLDSFEHFPIITLKNFLDTNEKYKQCFEKYAERERAEDFEEFKNMPELAPIADEGTVYSTKTITYNGEQTTVILSNATMSNGVPINKVHICANGVDPSIYIVSTNSTMNIGGWQIKYGENAYVGLNFPVANNEATQFRQLVNDWTTDQASYNEHMVDFFSLGLGIEIPYTVGEMIAELGTWTLGEVTGDGWASLRDAVIDTQDATEGNWFCINNWFQYSWLSPVGSQTYYVKDCSTQLWEEVPGFQVNFGDALFGNSGQTNAMVIMDAIVTARDAYGCHNQWAVISYDQTPKIMDPPIPAAVTVVGYDLNTGLQAAYFDVYVDSQYMGNVPDSVNGLTFTVEPGVHTISVTTSATNCWSDPLYFVCLQSMASQTYNNAWTLTISYDETIIANFAPY